MPEGLEFLKSWRFWVVLSAGNLLVTLGTVAAHIVSVLYLPFRAGEPEIVLPFLASLVWSIAVGSLLCIVCRGRWQNTQYPAKFQMRMAFTATVVSGLMNLAAVIGIERAVLMPIVPDYPFQGLLPVVPLLFGISYGRLIAEAEWTAMTGARDADGGE